MLPLLTTTVLSQIVNRASWMSNGNTLPHKRCDDLEQTRGERELAEAIQMQKSLPVQRNQVYQILSQDA